MGFDKQQRPQFVPSLRHTYESQVAASTALDSVGFFGLTSTSTDTSPLVHTLVPPKAGHQLALVVEAIATSSSPIHVNAGGSRVFDGSSGNMLVLSSAGAGCMLMASSSARWHLVGNNGVTVSTST